MHPYGIIFSTTTQPPHTLFKLMFQTMKCHLVHDFEKKVPISNCKNDTKEKLGSHV